MADAKSRSDELRLWAPVVAATVLMGSVALVGILVSHWQAAVSERAESARLIEQCQTRDCTATNVSAQVRAAGAAELTADLAFWSLALSALGLTIVGATLVANLRSTRAAVAAAAAAQASVEVAERTAKQQLRAYVVAELCKIQNLEDRQEPRFAVNIQNVGQTPALRLRIVTKLQILHEGVGNVAFPEISEELGPGADLGAGRGRQHSRLSGVTLADGGKQAFNERQLRFLFLGLCTYEDIFGEEHTMTFAHAYDRGDLDGRYYEHGNRLG